MRTEENRPTFRPEGERTAGAGGDFDILRTTSFKRIQDDCPDGAGPSLRPAVPSVHGAPANPLAKQTKRFVPSSLRFLIALDVVLISAGQTLVLADLHQRLFLNGDWQVISVIVLSLLLTLGSIYATGCYRRDSLVRFSSAISPLAVAIGLAAALLIGVMHFALADMFPNSQVFLSVSRCFTIALLLTAMALPICLFNRAAYFAMVRRHWFARRVLVVGTGTRAAYLQSLLNADAHRAHSELFFAPESVLGGASPKSARISNVLADTGKALEDLAHEVRADEVVIAVDEKRGLAVERLLSCKTSGIPVIEYDALIERETGRIDLRWLELSWLVYSPGFEIKILDSLLKRTLDIVISAGMLVISLPAVALAIAAVKLEDGGPAFYRQTRVTQGGRQFWIYKLRTMRVDAELQGAQWAAKNDSRTTQVGNFLRKSRIDEIPQLWNVLCGEMSLVGPRPERPVFIEQLSRQIPMYNFRHGVKAGLTGWAQINYPYGASIEDARAKLEYDLYYMKNYSVLRDLSIILQTFRILIWRVGAR
jgi:sugar transferase (PEP-CTERM system associated)